MAKVSLYLDSRSKNPVVKLSLSVNGKGLLVSLGVKLESIDQWSPKDPKGPVVRHNSARSLNTLINSRLRMAQEELIDLQYKGGEESFTIEMLRDRILKRINPSKYEASMTESTVRYWYNKFAHEHEGRTRELYDTTLKRLDEYCVYASTGIDPHDNKSVSKNPQCKEKGEKYAMRLSFDDITEDWLDEWNDYMERTMPTANARAIHLRNLRAACKYAYKEGGTEKDPFRNYSIKREETRHRALTPEQFKQLFTYKIPSEETELIEYRDISLLIFLLIGINVADLYYVDGIVDGRIYYDRRKTHKSYSIKVEKEAMRLIKKYAGKKYMLRYADSNSSHISLTKKLNTALKNIGPVTYITNAKNYGRGQKIKQFSGLFEDISVYWMRHTWATFAYKIGVSREDIARCLGHGRKTVTDIYIDYDQERIDQTNRKVIDYAMSLLR